jgi:predicted amidohydrolase YtcJ
MQAFVDRRTSSGKVFGNPDERLSPRQALAAYTTGAAAATGAAQAKGTLTPGKLADFTVLSGSPLTAPDIGGLRVLATAVGGAFTHGESSFRSPVRTGRTAGSPSSGTTFISTASNCS